MVMSLRVTGSSLPGLPGFGVDHMAGAPAGPGSETQNRLPCMPGGVQVGFAAFALARDRGLDTPRLKRISRDSALSEKEAQGQRPGNHITASMPVGPGIVPT